MHRNTSSVDIDDVMMSQLGISSGSGRSGQSASNDFVSETIEETMEITNNQPEQPDNPILPGLSAMTRNVTPGVNPCKNDIDTARRECPNLVQFLSDTNEQVVKQATYIVNQLTGKESTCRIILNNKHVMGAILKATTSTNDGDAVKDAVSALHNMAQYKQGLSMIAKNGGVSTLVRLLGHQVESVVFRSIAIIHNFILHQVLFFIHIYNKIILFITVLRLLNAQGVY